MKFDFLDAALACQVLAMLCLAAPMFACVGVACGVWDFGLVFHSLFWGWIVGFVLVGLAALCDILWDKINFPDK